MTRRPSDYVQESVVLAYDHVSVTATTVIKLFKVPRAMRIDKVTYINVTGLAEDANNWFDVKVVKNAAVVANWSTDSDGAGTNSIPANTFIDLTMTSTDADAVCAADDILSLDLTEGGTATLPAGRVVIEGRYL